MSILSQSTRERMIANIPYYEAMKSKNEEVTPEWGFPSTLDEIESALKNQNLPQADKDLISKWFDAFNGVKIKNDTTAEVRRESISRQITSLRGTIEQKTATIKALTYPFILDGNVDTSVSFSQGIVVNLLGETRDITVNGRTVNVSKVGIGDKVYWIGTSDLSSSSSSNSITYSGRKTPEQFQSELESSLAEFSEKDFGSIKNTIEKASKLIEGFERMYPEYREAMRGALGLMLLERFGKAGYKVNLQGNKINVISQKPENAPMATQIETYLGTQTSMKEILALGMIYGSSQIRAYSDIYITEDKKSIKPIPPNRDYIEYLKDIQKTSPNALTSYDKTLLESRTVIQSILSDPQKVKGIIIGTPFLASALERVVDDPKLQSAVTSATSQLINTNGIQSSGSSSLLVSPQRSASSERLPDWSSDPINRTLGEIGQGFSGGINKLMSTPGAFGGLLIATIATMIFGGFKNGLMVFGAGFGLSGIMDRLEKNGFNLGKTAQSAADATTEATTEAARKAKEAAVKAGVTTSPAPAPANAPTNDFQKDLRKKVEASGIATDVDKLANIKGSKYPGKLDDYLKFVETDMKDIPLSKLFPTDHKKSIFYPDGDPYFSVDKILAPVMLKKILREYLTGSRNLTGTGDKAGEIEKEAFLKQHNITSTDIQNKKLSDILTSVHKARVSGSTVAPVVPVSQNTQPQAPVATPLTKHKIGNIDVDVGKSVQTNIVTFPLSADGKEYANTTSKLPKDTNGKLYIPKDGVVKLGTNVLKINGVDHAEVEYIGEKVYVSIDQLKTITK